MLEILVIAFLLILNGVFALSELSIVSSKKARLAAMAEKGVAGARTALELAERPDQFLSAVQVGITLVGILSGVFGGAALANDFGALLERIPPLAPYADKVAYALIVVVLTYFSVVCGELVPKQLALTAPERFACLVAPLIKVLVLVARPAVWLLSSSSAAILTLLGKRGDSMPSVTEEEVNMLLMEAAKAGTIEEGEQRIAARALKFADRTAASIMTPRTEVVAIYVQDPPSAIREKVLKAGHSHYPVCDRSIDHVLGVLRHRAFVAFVLENELSEDPEERRRQVLAIATPPVFIPKTATATAIIDTMKLQRTHFAVVADEFAATVGVLSNHDLLESLVGYVPDANDPEEDAIVRREDGSLLVSGWISFADLHAELGLTAPSESDAETVAGHLLNALKRIPAVGDRVTIDGLNFEVVDMDRGRVDRVLVSPCRHASTEE